MHNVCWDCLSLPFDLKSQKILIFLNYLCEDCMKIQWATVSRWLAIIEGLCRNNPRGKKGWACAGSNSTRKHLQHTIISRYEWMDGWIWEVVHGGDRKLNNQNFFEEINNTLIVSYFSKIINFRLFIYFY